jgi:HK97 gp10 family phage protein
MKDGGLASFQRRMAAIPEAAKAAVAPVLLKQANQIAATMRSLAPEDEGALKASIAVTGPGQKTPAHSQPGGAAAVPENAVAITAGNTEVRYAHLVEHGTRARMTSSKSQSGHHPGTAAQSFFWPAFRLHRKKTAAAIKRAIGKAIREAK